MENGQQLLPGFVADGPAGAKYDASPLTEQLLETLRSEGIDDEKVLQALAEIPRHEFVPAADRAYAYLNRPLPIGEGQTISQPYIVALMTQLGDIDSHDKVLEIGTGSGYQTAVLSKLAAEVYTVEIVETLSKQAQKDLERLELADNVRFRIGDGDEGWPEAAPFDAILVTAAPRQVPRVLIQQLRMGGRLVIPLGDTHQDLRVFTKTTTGLHESSVIPVRFVPMTGRVSSQ